MTVMLLINVLLAVLDMNGKHQQLLANKLLALQDSNNAFCALNLMKIVENAMKQGNAFNVM